MDRQDKASPGEKLGNFWTKTVAWHVDPVARIEGGARTAC